jgi:molybdenum-dependent DNA-binding transcriptional regulator ModE
LASPQDRWNKFKMAKFLQRLAATHSVSAAARSVGMSRQSAYKLRARLKGEPFDIAWEAAFRHG